MIQKYLLCRPTGGFNDTLNQIMRSYYYCKTYNRCLLIDTKYESCFDKSFHEYFTFINIEINIIYNYNDIYNLITNNNFSTFPDIFTNNIFNYRLTWKGDGNCYINDTCLPIVNINTNYNEDIIIYNSTGGGIIESLSLLKIIKINDNIVSEIINRYNKINKPYISIHIRNTDYKTDYVQLYNNNKEIIHNNNIFLATDSKIVLEYFNNLKLNIFNFISTLNNENKPIHHKYINNDKHQVMIDTVCDLIILALGDRFILPSEYFGFTRLAYTLYNNKDIVYNLISNALPH